MAAEKIGLFVREALNLNGIYDHCNGRVCPAALKNEKDDVVPYIVYGSSSIDGQTDCKDDTPLYGDSDSTAITIIVCEKTYDDLCSTVANVRSAISKNIVETSILEFRDASFSAGPEQYDKDKPCYYRILSFQFEVENT